MIRGIDGRLIPPTCNSITFLVGRIHGLPTANRPQRDYIQQARCDKMRMVRDPTTAVLTFNAPIIAPILAPSKHRTMNTQPHPQERLDPVSEISHFVHTP